MSAARPAIVGSSYPLAPPRATGFWPGFAAILIVGYLCMFRSFSYLGLPWLHIYIGEIALALFLFFGPSSRRGSWLRVLGRVRGLKQLRLLLLLMLFYGAFEALRGIALGYDFLTVARDTGFNYYPIFLLLGIWVGLRDQLFLRRAVRVMAWFNGVYGVACVLFLSRIPWTLPGTADAASPVPLFSEPSGAAAVALLGLIVFEPQPRRVWHLIAMNAFVLLGLQVRGEWLAFAAGVAVFVWITKKFRRAVTATAPVFAILVFMYAAQVSLQSPLGRGDNVGTTGTSISVYYLVARAIAPLSQDLAQNLAPAEDVDFAAGTAEWRLVWWANIWLQVHSRISTALFGLGYGYPIGDLNPDIDPDTFIQTPHSVVFYALAFCGWAGLLLFSLLQIEIACLLWRTYRQTGQLFGFICWVALVAMAVFEPFFEAPYGAIPFYLLTGAAITPALLPRARTFPEVRPDPLPASPDPQPA